MQVGMDSGYRCRCGEHILAECDGAARQTVFYHGMYTLVVEDREVESGKLGVAGEMWVRLDDWYVALHEVLDGEGQRIAEHLARRAARRQEQGRARRRDRDAARRARGPQMWRGQR